MTTTSFWSYAEQNPDRLALVAPDGREWRSGELLADCNRILHGLRDLGLKKGDTVAAVLPNCAVFISLTLAVTQGGMFLVPINWHLAATEIAYILQDSDASVFIAHERISAIAVNAAKEAQFPLSAAFAIGEISGFRPFDELIQGQPDTLPKDRQAGAVMNYTSGTTGKPKAVKRAMGEMDPESMAGLMTMMLALFGIEPEKDNVHFCGSPLYHTGVMVWALNSLHYGHAVVLVDKWDAREMLMAIDQYKVTTSHMIHAAAPCPPEVKRAMIDWWGMSIFEYYAATEGGGTLVSPQEWLQYPGTVGKAWPTADIKIFDDDGNEQATGEKGTVYMLMSDMSRFEYKGDPSKTEENRIGDYFTAGDVGYLNAQGYLFLCDRKIDMIISGGANIYPAEIENVLIMHPKVADCCVFGIPNSDWGEEIKAVVQLLEGINGDRELEDELIAFCADKLGRMKLPRSIDYIEELPRDPNGKLYKRRLRDPYWESTQQAI